MIMQIGVIAGEIWRYLDEKGASMFSDIRTALTYPAEYILMSLGWLTREGHVTLKKAGEDYSISLREKESIKSG